MSGVRGLITARSIPAVVAVERVTSSRARVLDARSASHPEAASVLVGATAVAATRFAVVVVDLERLPFRGSAFASVKCDGLQTVWDDATAVAELARVTHAFGTLVLTTPNRRHAGVLWIKVRDRLVGNRRETIEYFRSDSHLREYTWAQFEALVRTSVRITARHPVAEQYGPTSRRLRWMRAPALRWLSPTVVVEGQPR